MTENYAANKKCWAPGGDVPLGALPQLTSLFKLEKERFARLNSFVAKCETELCESLRSDSLPTIALTDAIAVAKVKAVEDSIDLCQQLQNEVGSYALMAGTGFEQKDFLTCCKFAEGDSRVLMQKMARDRVRVAQKNGVDTASQAEEDRLVADLAAATNFGKDMAAWNQRWEDVYRLASIICDKTMDSFLKD
eukprot:NODE_3652_length_940_cov_25.597082_g3355_i0.p1 GENE.NODE_3652_length_940_cov_25.597082_g3355_i0~~NODE_3652_length_940_cov_25.597082_g3355_i0.p1  ORF type:complete len:224 (+),score=60.98 NODE_3652_length_940_cov_25.597082_g3355_i0:98-673(+)